MRIDKHTIYMRYPSTWWHDLWREGLVTGNGVIGANVYGGVKEETTMITHHDLWHRGKEDILPDVSDAFARQRQLMDEEKFLEASWEVVNALKEKEYKTTLESQLPLADLKMIIEPNKGFESYIRGVHMDNGEVGSEWVDGESLRSSYLFVSRTKDMIVKKVTSSKEDMNILFTLDMHVNGGSRKHKDNAIHVEESKEVTWDKEYMVYTAKNEDNTMYGVVVRILPKTGETIQSEKGIKVRKTSEVILLMKVFVKEDSSNMLNCIEEIKESLSKINLEDSSYDKLLAVHGNEHRRWYQSAELSLNYEGKFHCNEDLLAKAFSGKQPIELIEKLWRYGRYLFICGTSSHSNPFPLYGIWAGDYRLMWSHNMANENTQMIYWHSNVGNLLPFQEGLYAYYNQRIDTYKDNAKKLFGLKGLYMTAGTTPGVSTPNQVVPVIMNWVGAAGWIAEHYCDHYWYTKDVSYLKNTLLPYLEEVANFYEDFIEFYPDGSIHFYPSVSPENTPGNFMPAEHIQMAHPMPTTVNSTIDLAIVKEFFTNMIRIGKEQGLYDDKMELWNKILGSIPSYKTNSVGAIKEWQDDRFDERYAHRHLSHIYPVFPGYEVNSRYHSELLPAFKKAVELREIDAQTGWSMAHMSAIYARLEDGEQAMQALNNMAKSCLTNNLFSLHNDWRGMNISLCMDPAPVQLDAILGYVNGIQEMILYSSTDLVKLLPAISDELSHGKITDFRYTDGFIQMEWDVEKTLFEASLKAIRAHTTMLQLPKEFTHYQFHCEHCEIHERNGLYELSIEENGLLKITL